MSEQTLTVSEQTLDQWATDPAGPVALQLTQVLVPVSASGIVFPPTYADIGYNVDALPDGRLVATLDSFASQANRLEPLFKSESNNPDAWLVPQVRIRIRDEDCGECGACRGRSSTQQGAKRGAERCQRPRPVELSLLDLPHRAGDAVVRSSPGLSALVEDAFRRLGRGDASRLCTIAPTSLVFGVWDSRGTGEKRPRLVHATIRAWDVTVLHAAAQFNSVWKLLSEEQREKLESYAADSNVELAEVGFKDAPSVFRHGTDQRRYPSGSPSPDARVLGGILARGRIEREVLVNLLALRGLRGQNEAETVALRKYLLGLSLWAATAEGDLFLRQGCLLRHVNSGDQWFQVLRRDEPKPVTATRETVEAYTKAVAAHFRAKWPEAFRDAWPELSYKFDMALAKEFVAKAATDKKQGKKGMKQRSSDRE